LHNNQLYHFVLH